MSRGRRAQPPQGADAYDGGARARVIFRALRALWRPPARLVSPQKHTTPARVRRQEEDAVVLGCV
eukprot:2050153-Lingulodinium_polyedra.AAC.1